MARFYGLEVVKNFVKINTTVCRLEAGSKIKIGGQVYNLSSDLDISINDTASMLSAKTLNSLYYVYAVLDGGSVKLVADNSAEKPASYSSYRKVGAFYLEHRQEIYDGFSIGEQPKEEVEYYLDNGQPVTTTQLTTNGSVEKLNTLNYLANSETNGFIIMNANIDVVISAAASWNSTSGTTAVAIYTKRDSGLEKIIGLANAANSSFDQNSAASAILNKAGDYFYWRALSTSISDIRLYSTLSGYLFKNINWKL